MLHFFGLHNIMIYKHFKKNYFKFQNSAEIFSINN